mmetsp:Transcript_125688/g.305306  ORF Transcript_125688/g.305306 Transcript_125688/m.305306 type:complete len:448 (+) Transcript_125688:93-1436(+)
MGPHGQFLARVCSRRLLGNRQALPTLSLLHRKNTLSCLSLQAQHGIRSSGDLTPQRRSHSILASQRRAGNLINPVVDPYIKIWDVRHVRFAAPDLDVMEKFCHDFGMMTVSKSDSALYMRGHGDDAAVHITHKADDAAFIGFGLDAASDEDLRSFADATGLALEDYAEPGGGKVVRLESPEGYRLEVLAGSEKVVPSRATLPSVPGNFANERGGAYTGNRREGYVKRVLQECGPEGAFTPFGPNDPRAHEEAANAVRSSHVMRLGHVVIGCKDFRESERWWKKHFGLVTSDEIHAVGDESEVVGAFMRFDRGEAYTDHHSIFLIRNDGISPIGHGKGKQFFHAAFEVANIDDLFVGNTHLKNQREKGLHYHHARGIGRHINGSQVYDYWHDPFGHQLEHWTDGDQFNLADGSNRADVQQLFASQWGPTNVLREAWPGPKSQKAEPVG